MQIDFAFQRHDIRLVSTRHQSGWKSVCFHQPFSIANASSSGRIGHVFHIWKIRCECARNLTTRFREPTLQPFNASTYSAELSFCAKAVSSRSSPKAGVAELADALDSKFTNDRFHSVNSHQAPFPIFKGKSGRFRVKCVMNEGSSYGT